METNNRQHEWGLYHSFFEALYTDLAELISVPLKESQRDLNKIKKRFESEGLSFITKSLPSLGKAFDRALNRIEPFTVPTTFRRKVKGGKRQHYPNLFGYMFERVIGEDGWPLGVKTDGSASVDIDCLRGLRQLMYFVYKLEMPHDPEVERKLLQEFVDVDEGLERDPSTYDDLVLETASRIANAVFQNFDPHDIFPRHGKGAVATGEQTHEKHVFKRLYRQIDPVYPFCEYFEFSLSAVCDRYREYEYLEVLEAGTAKVVLVPKDSRGPRIISCEPLEYQWIQQGLGRAIVRHLESHWLTKERINFSDQSINQGFAYCGSTDGSTVTLDMKEASDRVATWLVKLVFKYDLPLLSALLATRSTQTELPDGRIVTLKKFAPMGSCLCFPVEAFIFWALGVASIIHDPAHAKEFSTPRKRVWSPLGEVLKRISKCNLHVYGDDIIVGKKYHESLLQTFPRYGLRFNMDKCCIRGLFRESCGVDAYDGHNVTPLRLKRRWCRGTADASTIASYVEFSNLAYERGYKRVAAYAAALVEEQMNFLPVQNRKSSYLAFIRPSSVIQIPDHVKRRFNKTLHRMEYRLWTIRPCQISTDPDSWCMVLRTQSDKNCVIRDEFEPLTEIAQSGTPAGVFSLTRRVCLKRVWTMIG
jgi:hypothetical protein